MSRKEGIELDYELKVNTESEHESLYSWSINEVKEESKDYLRDWINYQWGNYFTVKDISYSSHLECELPHDSDRFDKLTVQEYFKKRNEQDFDLTTSENLSGTLTSDKDTSYSMFGTDRFIEDFSLFIRRGDKEDCRVWGQPQNTYEMDFSYDTTPDSIQIVLTLKEDRFDELKQRIINKTISTMDLRIGSVDGFYSHWSPGISASRVKVLTKDHVLNEPEGLHISRLNHVGEWSLHTHSSQETEIKLTKEDGDDVYYDEDFKESKEPSYTTSEYLQKQLLDETIKLRVDISTFRKYLFYLLGFVIFLLIGSTW